MTSYLERHASKSPGRKNTILQAASSKHSQIQKIVTASLYCALQIPVRLCSIIHRWVPKNLFSHSLPIESQLLPATAHCCQSHGKPFLDPFWESKHGFFILQSRVCERQKRPCFCQYPSFLKALFFWKNSPPLIMKR